MFFRSPRPRYPRRGVTLVEMLVTVALLVLMMTVIVQIFQAATGAVSAARTFQDLDSGLRQLDATIRQDLGNLTARLTPPLDPKNNLGYFEYIENSFADNQGEDTDDCLRFTVKAPEGQIFTGRFFPAGAASAMNALMSGTNPTITNAQFNALKTLVPITIQSQYAEVIYFLRNGNLYRRVLLVAPEFQSSVYQPSPPSLTLVAGVFSPQQFTGSNNQTLVSWQGLNDLSAHPVPSAGPGSIVLNTLGHLTNRENRYAAPRFCNDFVVNSTGALGADGVPDDENPFPNGNIAGDSVNDFVPSLYFNPRAGLINEWSTPARSGASFATVAFPYVYPYAYSTPDPSGSPGVGWIHSPTPTLSQGTFTAFASLNHSPLEIGDSLPTSYNPSQTWWGFPTWRETMSPNWMDPWWFPGAQATPAQATGLNPFVQNTLATSNNTTKIQMLPPMTTGTVGSATASVTTSTPYRTSYQPYNDSAGSDTFAVYSASTAGSGDFLWRQCWEDDLVLSGVRSFDVKAYDNAFPGYVDLGWGDDARLTSTANTQASWTPPLLTGNNTGTPPPFPLPFPWPIGTTTPVSLIGQTYAHEGRIPPLLADWRLNPQMENELSFSATGNFSNVGDNSATAVRLRRTFDTWSTDYTNAPSTGVSPPGPPSYGLPYGLGIRGQPPIYPSYPAPYPMPLRGLQIQIRVVDPRNERVKVLTIRQDFSDKL